ncbi:hypothetical protein [Winogradskyella sp. PC D3.3]
MDKDLLGNFIIAFPTAAYITYTLVIKTDPMGINWTTCIITGLIATVSYGIGTKIKNKGNVE